MYGFNSQQHSAIQHGGTLSRHVYSHIVWFPSQLREAPFRALALGEGINSAWLFTPGKRKALAKSEVPDVSP